MVPPLPDPSFQLRITDPNQVPIDNTIWKIVDLTHKPSLTTSSEKKGKHNLSKLPDQGAAVAKTAQAATEFFATLSEEDRTKILQYDSIRIVTEQDLEPMKFRHTIPLIGGFFARQVGSAKIVKIVDGKGNDILSMKDVDNPNTIRAADRFAATVATEIIPQCSANTISLKRQQPSAPRVLPPATTPPAPAIRSMTQWLASKRGHADNLPSSLRKFNYDITTSGNCGPAAVAAALLKRYETNPDRIADDLAIFNVEHGREQNLKELLAQINASGLDKEAAINKLQNIIRHHVAHLAERNTDKDTWLAMLNSLETRYGNNPSHLQAVFQEFGYTSSAPIIDQSQVFTPTVEQQFAGKISQEYIRLITTDKEYVDHTFFMLLQPTLPIQLYAPHGQRPSEQGFELQKLLADNAAHPIHLFFVSFILDPSSGQRLSSQHYTLIDDAATGESFEAAYQSYLQTLPPRS